MKKLILSLLVTCMLAPSLSMADPVSTTAQAPAASAPIVSDTAPASSTQAPVKKSHTKHAPDFVPSSTPANDMTSPNAAPAAEPAKKTVGTKSCNPKKSKLCGKACIPLARTCHK